MNYVGSQLKRAAFERYVTYLKTSGLTLDLKSTIRHGILLKAAIFQLTIFPGEIAVLYFVLLYENHLFRQLCKIKKYIHKSEKRVQHIFYPLYKFSLPFGSAKM